MKRFYLVGSRVATHVGFWLAYYLAFGFIWANDGNYWASYYLEFVLLPVRMLAAYVTLYVLIPRFLQPKMLGKLVGSFALLILGCAMLQRTITYFFYEGVAMPSGDFWEISGILRNIILINSTVLFLSALKITQLWWQEGSRVKQLEGLLTDSSAIPNVIKIKSDKRIHRVSTDDLLYIEGLGNYVVLQTKDRKLISYMSLKQALDKLPPQFQRIHKSYVINTQKVSSYDQENVEIGQKLLPVGRAYKQELIIS
ncbi:MAG: LytR/AlgR family response regulator transcription factor [Cyclobacteriaceae bacterium]